MALCFFAVIILSLFTGIAIGYIVFEFYVMTRVNYNFNYVEGDEVNSFLEEIRRSKDNGAKMLNYNTTTNTKTNTARPQRVRPVSLSSLIRENMQAKDNPVEAEEVFKSKTNLEEITSEEDVKADECENTEEMLDEEFVPDDEFLKKYYYDKEDLANLSNNEGVIEEEAAMSDKEISTDGDKAKAYDGENSSSVADENSTESAEESGIEDSVANENDYDYNFDNFDDFSCINDTDNKGTIDEEQTTNDNKTMPEVAILDTEDSATENVNNVDNTEPTNNNKNQTFLNTGTEIVLPRQEKKDKIVSNVCINLGGNTSSSTNGFINIPLTMTEKPVEPEVPPKRKRGRPPKKKKV